jgi:hypothetical protein
VSWSNAPEELVQRLWPLLWFTGDQQTLAREIRNKFHYVVMNLLLGDSRKLGSKGVRNLTGRMVQLKHLPNLQCNWRHAQTKTLLDVQQYSAISALDISDRGGWLQSGFEIGRHKLPLELTGLMRVTHYSLIAYRMRAAPSQVPGSNRVTRQYHAALL